MKNIYLTITGYILMSYYCSPSYLGSWYLEGRNSTNEAWKRIDERSGETDLKGKKKIKKFSSNKISSCTFKIFRLTQTKNTDGSNLQLGLGEMDFVDKNSFRKKQKRKKKSKLIDIFRFASTYLLSKFS